MASPSPTNRSINRSYCTTVLSTAYPHAGLFDVSSGEVWIARKRWRTDPATVSHARMLKGGSDQASTAEKDRFVCFWFHPPHSGEIPSHGHPIALDEAHLVVRLDPQWSYRTQSFVAATDVRRVRRNTDEQFAWGAMIFEAYLRAGLRHPTSYHMLGPGAPESVFALRREDP